MPAGVKKRVSLLTGGKDTPYALGLLSGLISSPIVVDVIGNDEMKDQELMRNEQVAYYNLRGDQSSTSPFITKVARLLKYYVMLVSYTAKTDSKIFHILWLNKFIFFDSTILNLYYKLMGKKLIYTAHNVNAGERDGTDSLVNRFSLRFLYNIVDHIFVHTGKMKDQLVCEFGIDVKRITVIPFGVNNTLPRSQATSMEAREKLALDAKEKVILFFGNIAPYKGLDILIRALAELKKNGTVPRLVIAGQVKDSRWISHWESIERVIEEHGLGEHIVRKIEYIPDEEVEFYCKAADVLILPYRHIFQSGVLFLAYSFGLPVIAADVGSLRDDIMEGQTGFVFRAEKSADLAEKISRFFDSDLYKNREAHREIIMKYANETYSWQTIGEATYAVYDGLR
jgi:glycosyltransferase involved in cell wall biosynthesis